MLRFLIGFMLTLCFAGNPVLALSNGDLPTETAWYLHMDMDQMDSTVTGQHLSAWLSEEVFDEIRDELGFSLDEELSGITVFGSGEKKNSPALILHGRLSEKAKDEIMGLMKKEATDLKKESHSNAEVYSFSDVVFGDHHNRVSAKTDDDKYHITASSDEKSYLAFGNLGQTLLTQNEALLKQFLNDGGQIRNQNSNHPGALMVLQADRTLIQGGMGRDFPRHGPWNSSIGKNMNQVAVILFDESGMAALDVSLVADDPETAEALNNVVKGLIALKTLAMDDEPELAQILQDTDAELIGNTVTIRARVDPEVLVEFFE